MLSGGRERAFFRDDAKARASRAVKAIEAQTSAEVVVAVRLNSGNYRANDYHAGFAAMAILVATMLVSPTIFTWGTMAIEGISAFAFGALLSAKVSVLRRWMARKKTLCENALHAGRAAFYELGISNTSGRNGLLVFVSIFERTCVVVPDIGIRPERLTADYRETCDAITQATERMDLDGFLAALERLGPALGQSMPRQADDVNELPDEVQ